MFCMMAQTRLFNDREAYMAIKAIAMDIDGTLTNDQKVLARVRARSCSRHRNRASSSFWLRAVLHGAFAPLVRSSTYTIMMACSWPLTVHT